MAVGEGVGAGVGLAGEGVGEAGTALGEATTPAARRGAGVAVSVGGGNGVAVGVAAAQATRGAAVLSTSQPTAAKNDRRMTSA